MNVAKDIHVQECSGLERHGEYVRAAVPFAKGECYDTAGLNLTTGKGLRQQVQVEVLNCWHDGSLKWVIVDFAASVSANSTSLYRLTTAATETLDSATTPTSITRAT